MTIPKKIFTICDKKLNISVENHLRVFFEGWDFQSFTTNEIHEILMNDNYPNYSFLPYLFDNADENTKKIFSLCIRFTNTAEYTLNQMFSFCKRFQKVCWNLMQFL